MKLNSNKKIPFFSKKKIIKIGKQSNKHKSIFIKNNKKKYIYNYRKKFNKNSRPRFENCIILILL